MFNSYLILSLELIVLIFSRLIFYEVSKSYRERY
nr:MAG TPA: hypothetical protein [Caudoviricetes sp.]